MDDGLSLASDIDDDDKLSVFSIFSNTSVRIALNDTDTPWGNFIHQLKSKEVIVQQQQSEEVIVQDFSSVNTASSNKKVKRKYFCSKCGSDFTTARRLRTHQTSKTMICENKRQRKDDDVSLPPHAAIGETFNGCIKRMNDLIKQNSSEEKIRSNVISRIDFLSNRFFFSVQEYFCSHG